MKAMRKVGTKQIGAESGRGRGVYAWRWSDANGGNRQQTNALTNAVPARAQAVRPNRARANESAGQNKNDRQPIASGYDREEQKRVTGWAVMTARRETHRQTAVAESIRGV